MFSRFGVIAEEREEGNVTSSPSAARINTMYTVQANVYTLPQGGMFEDELDQ